MDRKPILEIRHIEKSFQNGSGEQNVLHDVTLEVEEGQVYCILGYSGCGKTTLLRIISALETADAGEIVVDGAPYRQPSKAVLLVFQEFDQLFPWRSVLKNIVHTLMVTKSVPDRAGAVREAEEVLKEVGLYGSKDRYPRQLSGGMKQRAAVARAFALRPKILLMDEPFANLDTVTRRNLQKLVREKCRKYGITVVFVTHGVEEAVLVGDKIVVMRADPGEICLLLENTYLKTGDNKDKMKLMSAIMEQMDAQMR